MFLTLSFIMPHHTFIGSTYDLLAEYHHTSSFVHSCWSAMSAVDTRMGGVSFPDW